MATDAELRSTIDSCKAKKERYERVKNSISSNGLDYKRDVSNMNDFIDYCEEIISLVNSDEGYHYLDRFAEKLQEDVDTMTEYRDFVRDANTSFQNLYRTLERKISTLDTQITNARNAYNEGKSFLEKLYW